MDRHFGIRTPPEYRRGPENVLPDSDRTKINRSRSLRSRVRPPYVRLFWPRLSDAVIYCTLKDNAYCTDANHVGRLRNEVAIDLIDGAITYSNSGHVLSDITSVPLRNYSLTHSFLFCLKSEGVHRRRCLMVCSQ